MNYIIKIGNNSHHNLSLKLFLHGDFEPFDQHLDCCLHEITFLLKHIFQLNLKNTETEIRITNS